MTELREVGRIQIDEDPAFLHREWRVQRIGWVLIALILVLALTGLFGRGPLAHAQAGERALALEYERILRYSAPTDLDIRVTPVSSRDSVIALHVSRAYYDRVEISTIVPRPDKETVAGDDVVLHFLHVGPEPLRVRVTLEPQRYFKLNGELRAAGAAPVRFDQLILP